MADTPEHENHFLTESVAKVLVDLKDRILSGIIHIFQELVSQGGRNSKDNVGKK